MYLYYHIVRLADPLFILFTMKGCCVVQCFAATIRPSFELVQISSHWLRGSRIIQERGSHMRQPNRISMTCPSFQLVFSHGHPRHCQALRCSPWHLLRKAPPWLQRKQLISPVQCYEIVLLQLYSTITNNSLHKVVFSLQPTLTVFYETMPSQLLSRIIKEQQPSNKFKHQNIHRMFSTQPPPIAAY
jgi:hypothetical protein